MKIKKKQNVILENFDSLFVGRPADIEKNLKNLLPEAQALENKSIYLQILSQIALAQAMQQKFKLAHKTLDHAETFPTTDYPVGHARILLERGRVFHQSFNNKSALPYFMKSYQYSKKHKLDTQASNAAHLLAVVVKTVNEKIKWNKKSIAINNKSKDKKTRDSSMIDYHNLGSNYIEAKKYKNALQAYKRAEQLATRKGMEIIALGTQWGIARSLRSLNEIDKALTIQLELLDKYNTLYQKRILPIELLRVVRGQVYEELTEIYLEKAKKFSSLGYADLSKDKWFVKLEPMRLNKMKKLSSKQP